MDNIPIKVLRAVVRFFSGGVIVVFGISSSQPYLQSSKVCPIKWTVLVNPIAHFNDLWPKIGLLVKIRRLL
jgi:hypothetical protein